ncbi:adrenoleukodystrophy protein [Mycena olivaceomarginata]|nr:adrenoleukodystrophy protein [Mycena olivaceomarginata]
MALLLARCAEVFPTCFCCPVLDGFTGINRESSADVERVPPKGYARNRPAIQRVLNAAFAIYAVGATYRGLSARPSAPKKDKGKGKGKGDAKDESGKPPRIVIPGLTSKEALLLVMHSSLLVFRTVLSLYFGSRAAEGIFFNILRWLLVAIPATWTNSWLNFIQSKLAIAYRTRLTNEVLKQYLGSEAEGPDGKVYYKLANLDDRIVNADQMITNDIQKFSVHLAAIYSNLAKPVLDVILYNYQLSQNTTAAMLRYLTPPFGMYTAMSAQLSGSLRHTHSRLVEFAEEVAFMRGEETEKMLLEREYASVMKHENHVLNRRWWFGCIEEGVIKWLWGSFGAIGSVCHPGVLQLPGIPTVDLGGRTEGFITNRRLLLSSSGRLRDLSELAGYTARVSLLLDTMKDVRKGKFDKALVSSATTGENAEILKGRGEVIESEDIQFENVPIVTPNGDVLVKSLSFHVKPGQHLLIVGPNGILGGLWPPAASAFILIPQRPYLSLGTLRDQIIYPHSKADMEARTSRTTTCSTFLSAVQMDHIVEREGGWDAAKGKIAWARLFYHNPKYAILDEATSLVPQEMEGLMMQHATRLGITLLTVSHRPSLWQWHHLILQYNGTGGYVFTKLDAERRLALQEEKQALEAKLLEVPKMTERLAELRLLAEGRK